MSVVIDGPRELHNGWYVAVVARIRVEAWQIAGLSGCAVAPLAMLLAGPGGVLALDLDGRSAASPELEALCPGAGRKRAHIRRPDRPPTTPW
ncbi:MAG: hypothetical protein R3E83_19015 [Burkholderiaceae bacterium]